MSLANGNMALEQRNQANLRLLVAMLLDELEVPPLRLARLVEGIKALTDGEVAAALKFRTWHHAGLEAFVADLAEALSFRAPARTEPDASKGVP